MKQILIITFVLTLTACNFLGNRKTNSLTWDEEEDQPKSKSGIGFQEHFINELIENNSGDLGKEKKNSELMTKAHKLTDITIKISEEFGVDVVYPQFIDINKDDFSKVEISFSVQEIEQSSADNIKRLFKGEMVTEDMEYQILVKICLPKEGPPYVDMHCPMDDCNNSFKQGEQKTECKTHVRKRD